MTESTQPRFVADAMLGTLAKWLRILGYDTLYDPRADDNELVRLARAEDRLLLTRDVSLARRRGVRTLFITSEDLEDQLRQVCREARLNTNSPFSRCPVCNTPLEDVPRGEAWGQVPPYVFQSHERFALCPQCNQFYWQGTHWDNMRARLRRLEDFG
ncbi:MAG: Mut7-C RNAse domain-containing protein [Chloroflexi bacterium]|nr:Mut7-C RNAse domain-containing protein [Chloroflexota bacterium]